MKMNTKTIKSESQTSGRVRPEEEQIIKPRFLSENEFKKSLAGIGERR